MTANVVNVGIDLSGCVFKRGVMKSLVSEDGGRRRNSQLPVNSGFPGI